MTRHPFSRRSRRRKRTAALRGLRFAGDPIAEFGDGCVRIKPRFQKIVGKRILRWSSGRRLGAFRLLDPQGAPIPTHYRPDPDPQKLRREEIERMMRLNERGDVSVDHATEHGA